MLEIPRALFSTVRVAAVSQAPDASSPASDTFIFLASGFTWVSRDDILHSISPHDSSLVQ
jgi:hypothetical protein